MACLVWGGTFQGNYRMRSPQAELQRATSFYYHSGLWAHVTLNHALGGIQLFHVCINYNPEWYLSYTITSKIIHMATFSGKYELIYLYRSSIRRISYKIEEGNLLMILLSPHSLNLTRNIYMLIIQLIWNIKIRKSHVRPASNYSYS
jgi:hypothetical protein